MNICSEHIARKLNDLLDCINDAEKKLYDAFENVENPCLKRFFYKKRQNEMFLVTS